MSQPGPVSLKIRYRPLRIGWCIEADSLDDFSAAVALTHVFWGGRFNPIIPCANQELAPVLVRAFNVDALYNISGSAAVDAFIKTFPHIQWPEFQTELFIDTGSGRQPTLLDVAHPARHLYDTHVDRRQKPAIDAVFYEFEATDPLRFALHATCGNYPAESIAGRDYALLFQRAFATPPMQIASTEPLPADLHRKLTPNGLTAVELDPVLPYYLNWDEPGFYYGNALDFTDLVNFWNLRACDIELFFYDPNHAARLRPFVTAYSELLRNRPKPPHSSFDINVWQKDRDHTKDLSVFGGNLSVPTFDAGIFNGLNLNPPVMSFPERSVLGVSAQDDLGVSVTCQLPEKPFFSDIEFHSQMVVVSVSAANIRNAMLTPPFIPQLNEYYGRNAYFIYNKARAERDSLGIIENVTADQLTLRALPFTEVICKIFQTFGIDALPSQAGLVTARLIEQMGGLQGCRVFKIAGVRSLIKKYPPAKTFERTEAITMIGDNDPVSHKPRFEAYERLYIEPRETRELKPGDAFLYLLKKAVFRAGLKLICPTCQLDSWVSLDDAKAVTRCDYCGFEFNVLPQLRDRNWAYRRSGLFGRDDNQRGGIPVAVTLQQLEIAFHRRLLAYAPGIDLKPGTAPIENCEADFVALLPSLPRSGKPLELVVAECKDSGGEITDEDVRKLSKVAEALRDSPCEVFILFSKCGRFTPEEIERCKGARRKLFEHQGKTHYLNNVIMLSASELEPYFLYEQADKQFQIKRYVNSLEDLAINTVNIFFEPKPKPSA
jgi:hypothetical protein